MRTNKLLGLAAASLALLAGRTGHAQTYSNAVMTLNPPPVGYWPLNETTQPPTPGSLNLTAHNSGTLGTAGDGLYGAWYQASGASWYITNNIVLTNAQFTGDGSMALLCQSTKNGGVPGQYVVVPHAANGVANDALTIKLPFSVECWAYIGATNSAARILVAQGTTRTDCGGSDPNNPYNGGTFQALPGFELLQYQDYISFMTDNTNSLTQKASLQTSGYNKWQGFKVGQLVHIVATIDASGHKAIYTNGVLCVSQNLSANKAGLTYVPDPVSPIMIGSGPEVPIGKCVPTESVYSPYSGAIDDVAIYTNALTSDQALAHYQAAANGTYAATVEADNPLLFYRFDDSITPVNAGYDTGSFPAAKSYGSEGPNANGVYQPGTTPGVAGPNGGGFGANSRAVAINGAFGTVNVGNGNLPMSLNPTGAVPLTVVGWFKGAPADSPNRYQEIVGHGDSSYRLGVGWAPFNNNNGTNVGNHFNPGPGPELQFDNIVDETTNGFALNDGKWHMVAGVSDGTNDYMYLDGRLAKAASNASGINILGSTNDLILGGDPQYTYASAGSENTIRNYNGSIAQVALWTNALSPAQIEQLYEAAGVPVNIVLQPSPISADAGTVTALSVGVNGSAPFTYQWYKNGSPVGANSSSLSFNPLGPNDAGNYYVAVTNAGGYAISATVTVAVASKPVLVEQSPTDVHVFMGATPTLYVSANGPSLSYQWSSGSGQISGATSSSYTLPAVTGNGTYTCAINNSYGATNSSTISVTAVADPAAAYPQTILADHPVAYYRLDETAGTTAYDYAGGLNGIYTNVVLNQQPGYSTNDPTVGAAWFGSLNPIDSFAGYTPSFLSFAAPAGSHSQFSVEAWVNGGYSQSLDAGIVTCGYGNGGEQFDLDTGGKDPNHNWRWIVRDASGTAHVVNGTTGPHDNYWHHLVGVCDQANGNILLYVDGVQQGTAAITATGGILPWNTPMSIGSRRSAISTNNYDSQFYGYINDVSVYNYALSPAQVASHYLASGVAPMITMQPTNTTVNDGGTAYFYATATGTAPLSYQWYDAYSNPLPGQTNATLVLKNVDVNTMNGNGYQLTVTNIFGAAQSQYAFLSIVAGSPYIDTDIQPLFNMGYVGSPLTYSVSVSGSAPLHYQWKLNGANIAGATSSSYSGVSVLGTNYYQVAVTNNANPNWAVSSVATNVGVAVPTLNPSDYTYKTKITFQGYNKNETLMNFPALVLLGTNVPGFSYSQLASASGGDLHFTDASGTREIPHEIDQWNPGGTSTVWVQIPTLSSNTDYIYAYWGNPAATTPEAWTTNGQTWVPAFGATPSFMSVYHLKESAAPYLDSTMQFPATTTSAPTSAPGIVGLGEAFSGGNFLDQGAITLSNAFTVSAWVNVSPSASSIQMVWANSGGGWNANGYRFYVNDWTLANFALVFESGDGVGGTKLDAAPNSVPPGQWHLVDAVIDHDIGSIALYVDGTLLASGSSLTTAQINNDVNIGQLVGGGSAFNGSMDEVRICNATNSVNRIWADYMTVAQNSTFQSYSSVGSSAVSINYQTINGKLVLTWPQGTLLYGTDVNAINNVVSGATSPYTNSITGPTLYFRVKVR